MNDGTRKKITTLFLAMVLPGLALVCCDMYGQAEGGDETLGAFAGIIEPWRGVWYSYSGGLRSDGYRIGRWSEIASVMGSKLDLFPDFDPGNPRLHDGYELTDQDYFFFYDDTVYGEDENGEGGNGGWRVAYRYIGIVRAVNAFTEDGSVGAVIIEYLEGCYPGWSQETLMTPLPFFGIYYRAGNPDSIRLANAVVLADIPTGIYHTETATLEEAVEKNNAENDSKFISWGVVMPQRRE
jgi:hypothetical protein